MYQQKSNKKRAGSCPSLGWGSCTGEKNVKNFDVNRTVFEAQEVLSNKEPVYTDVCLPDSSKNVYSTRFVYSSKVNPTQIDALMAKKSKTVKNCKDSTLSVQSRVIWGKYNFPKIQRARENEHMCEVKGIHQYEKMSYCKNVRGGHSPTSDKVSESTAVQNVDVKNIGKCVRDMVEVKKSPTIDHENELDRHASDVLAVKVISI